MKLSPTLQFELLMREAKITGWQTEYRFHPVRRWRFDYCFEAERIAVEIEGGIWSKGRHIRPTGFLNDCIKYNAAALLGWRVFRFPTDLVTNGEAIKTLQEALKNGISARIR